MPCTQCLPAADPSPPPQREACIKRARRLLGLLVTTLRQNNCLSAEAQERERSKHFPSDFVPYVFILVERWKR